MDTTTQEPRRLRPAAGRGGSPTPRRPPQAGDGRPEPVPGPAGPSGPRGSRAGVDHGANGRARGGTPPASRSGNNRGGNARGSAGGGRNGAAGNSGRAVAGRAGAAVVDAGPGNGGRRHLRVVGQPAAGVGPGLASNRLAGSGQSATGAPARPSARPQPERSRTGAQGTASRASSGTTAPGRTGSVSAGPAAPQAKPSVAREAGAAAAVPLPRIPFVLLVLALLGGGLICLLVVNTTLGATSFRISQLQSDNAKLSLQEQTLLDQVGKEQSPQGIEQRAYQLGMRTPATSNILDLRNRRFANVPDHPGLQGQDAAVAPPAGRTLAAGRRTRRHHEAAHHKRTATRAGSSR